MARRVLRLGHLFSRARLSRLAVNAAILSVIPLSFAFGSFVEFQKYDRCQLTLQAMSDKAAVAGAWIYFTNRNNTELDRRIAGESEIEKMLHRWEASQTELTNVRWKVNTDPAANRFDLEVMADSPTILKSMPFVGRIPLRVSSSVDPARRSLEVALVLDSSASLMELDRFSAMRRMAKDYVNDLMDVAGPQVRVSVVPWASLVNINSEPPAPASDASVRDIDYLLQGSGRSAPPPVASRLPVLAEPTDPVTALSAERLATLARPTQWRGCVRSAPGEVSVNSDNIVVKAIDDLPPPSGLWPAALLGSSLQTPFAGRCTAYEQVEGDFGSDNQVVGRPTQASSRRSRDRRSKPPARLLKAQLVQQCVKWSYSPAIHQCLGSAANSALADHQNGTLNPFQPFDQACSDDLASSSPVATGSDRSCLSDPNEFEYLKGGGAVCPWEPNAFAPASAGVWGHAYPPVSGPNINCPAAILPLSSNRQQILDKLNELYAVPGGSQSDVGLTWALRTLSPRRYWADFWGLGQGLQAAPFGQAVRKIVVLITDGRNEAPIDFEGYYGCSRKGRNGAGPCWRSSNLATLGPESLNALTLSACQVMRETYGINVYVILTNIDDDRSFESATNCTGDSAKVFYINGDDTEKLVKASFVDFFSLNRRK